jgi:hypothetical protein
MTKDLFLAARGEDFRAKFHGLTLQRFGES